MFWALMTIGVGIIIARIATHLHLMAELRALREEQVRGHRVLQQLVGMPTLEMTSEELERARKGAARGSLPP